jgi:hypothetical protein
VLATLIKETPFVPLASDIPFEILVTLYVQTVGVFAALTL